MNLSQPDQPKDRTEIALRSDIFPSRDIRAAAEVVIQQVTDSFRRALDIANADNLPPCSAICRVCVATAYDDKANEIPFTSDQLEQICRSAGKSLHVSPAIGSWAQLVWAAVADHNKQKKRFHEDDDVPATTKDVPNIKLIEDDTPLDVHDYGDDLSSINPETISGATPALPGSEEKLLTLKARIQAGLPLWRPDDRRE